MSFALPLATLTVLPPIKALVLWKVLGWLGNACFFSRVLVQWLESEKVGYSAAPRKFWWLSIAGTLFLGAYTVSRGEPVLLFGFVINGLIYARNLSYGRPGSPPPPIGLFTTAFIGFGATIILFLTGVLQAREDWSDSSTWLAVVLLGQALWTSRFLVQWWATERHGVSHFPVAFWWISLVGNALLLSYALHLWDEVYIAGYVIGPIVQVRNLILGKGPAASRRPTAETND